MAQAGQGKSCMGKEGYIAGGVYRPKDTAETELFGDAAVSVFTDQSFLDFQGAADEEAEWV